jgi:hypothetical protein
MQYSIDGVPYGQGTTHILELKVVIVQDSSRNCAALA